MLDLIHPSGADEKLCFDLNTFLITKRSIFTVRRQWAFDEICDFAVTCSLLDIVKGKINVQRFEIRNNDNE